MNWMDIETAPRHIVGGSPNLLRARWHEYGPYILVWPRHGEVVRARWWQVKDENASNFIGDDGNAVYPTHWMPLPDSPYRFFFLSSQGW